MEIIEDGVYRIHNRILTNKGKYNLGRLKAEKHKGEIVKLTDRDRLYGYLDTNNWNIIEADDVEKVCEYYVLLKQGNIILTDNMLNEIDSKEVGVGYRIDRFDKYMVEVKIKGMKFGPVYDISNNRIDRVG